MIKIKRVGKIWFAYYVNEFGNRNTIMGHDIKQVCDALAEEIEAGRVKV